MSTTITEAMVREFGTNIDLLQQQLVFAFRGKTRPIPIVSAEAYEFDQIASVDMQDIQSRHQDTYLVDTVHSRRVLQPRSASIAELIDEADAERILVDPQSAYVQNFGAASNRKHDDRIIASLFATATTGKGGASTAAFDTSNFQIAHGSAGLTIGKMRTAAFTLESNLNPKDENMNMWYLGYTAKQLQDLLEATEITSADYHTVRALEKGDVKMFMGFEHFRTERFSVASSIRSCVAYRKMSVAFGAIDEGSASIRVRADKEDSVQVRYRNTSGATRADEKGVVEVLCDES